MFEMTASLLMQDAGRLQQVLKCPDELLPILGRGNNYLTQQDGISLRHWVDGGSKLDPDIERFRNSLQTVTESGLSALQLAWTATPAKTRGVLGREFIDTLKQSAIAYDEQRSSTVATPDVIANLNNKVASASNAPIDDAF